MGEIEFIQRAFFLKWVPKEYLIRILNNKKFTIDELKQKFYITFGKRVDNPKERIKGLPHYKLVEFFIKSEILKIDKEKELFFEFRDSRDPIFYSAIIDTRSSRFNTCKRFFSCNCLRRFRTNWHND